MAKPATAISTPGRATLPWSRRPPVKRKKWHRSPSPNIELRERLEYAEPHMTALKLSLAFLSISLILPAQQWERDEDDDPAARQGWFYNQRAFPFASIPPGARRNAMLQIARTDALARQQRQAFLAAATGQNLRTVAAVDSANWTLIGPRPTDGGTARATDGHRQVRRGHPRCQPDQRLYRQRILISRNLPNDLERT